MSKNKFKLNGVHLESNKLSADIPISRMPAPKVVYIPLSQHIGKHTVSIVKVGDRVLKGQLIAKGGEIGDISALVFSSVSGTVTGINIKRPSPSGIANHIQIENDGLDELYTLPQLSTPTKEEIVQRVYECGIVGMGGAGFPTHIKLNTEASIDTLILNGVECEPYITCDYRLMLEYTHAILKGALYMAQCVDAKNIILSIKENDVLQAHLQSVISSDTRFQFVTIMPLESIYPLGGEKQLIYKVTGKKVPARALPSQIGVVVSNVSTALAVRNAIEKGVSSFERVVTVTGKGVKKPCNVLVSNGTSIEDLLEYAEVDPSTLVKLVVGGPMMGTAVNNVQLVTTKTMNCLLALTAEETDYEVPSPCINCTLCSQACPMRLMPMFITKFGNANDAANSAKYGAKDCIECGCCDFVCPAKIPLVSEIRNAKKMITKEEKKSKITY